MRTWGLRNEPKVTVTVFTGDGHEISETVGESVADDTIDALMEAVDAELVDERDVAALTAKCGPFDDGNETLWLG